MNARLWGWPQHKRQPELNIRPNEPLDFGFSNPGVKNLLWRQFRAGPRALTSSDSFGALAVAYVASACSLHPPLFSARAFRKASSLIFAFSFARLPFNASARRGAAFALCLSARSGRKIGEGGARNALPRKFGSGETVVKIAQVGKGVSNGRPRLPFLGGDLAREPLVFVFRSEPPR